MKVAGGLLVSVDDGNLVIGGRSEMLRGLREVIDRALDVGVGGAHVMTPTGVSEVAVKVMDSEEVANG